MSHSHLFVPRKLGALPDFMILDFIRNGLIRGANEGNINPASLDLSVSEEMYRIDDSFFPEEGESIDAMLHGLDSIVHPPGYPMEIGGLYLVRARESFAGLGTSVYGYCNPKSSTGRTFVHVRMLADGVPQYDTLPRNYRGTVWFLIRPQTIAPIILPGETLTQVRFFNQDMRLNQTELEMVHRLVPLLKTRTGAAIPFEELNTADMDGSVIISLDLESEFVGLEANGYAGKLPFSARNVEVKKYYRIVRGPLRFLRCRRDRFGLYSSWERIIVPPFLACEVVPMNDRHGEFRNHYAGFVDPGFGYGPNGEMAGSTITLEARFFEQMVIRPGQAFAKVKFEWMCYEPHLHYEAKPGSNYTGQTGVRPSKHFKWPPK
jgi:dCTP deaminase